MANDYLIYKWRLWFRMYDTKNAGKIHKKDMKEDEELFAELSHIGDDIKKNVMKTFDDLWETIVFKGRNGPITEEEFIEAHRRDFKEDKENFKRKMEECYTKLFDIFDVSGKGSVTFGEFIQGFKAIHENITLEKTYFEGYHPVDGKVPCKKLVDSWVHFLTCDDSTQSDLVKVALECGL